jgi:glycerol-3-phosphate dehydrogenase (NAD(P)+)
MIGVLGGGAFGTALAVVLGRGGSEVRLWSRSAATLHGEMPRLPGVSLGGHVQVTPNMDDLHPADPVLLALPMQALSAVSLAMARQAGRWTSTLKPARRNCWAVVLTQ